MTKFLGLRAKPYSFLIDDGSNDKKRKGKFEKYENCLEANQLKNKIHYLEKTSKIDSLR